eukprot:11489483-Ditylum_brightwellii.AAC.1
MRRENRFNYIVRLFAGTIAGPRKPIILFLDGLHWADTASLNILRSFLLDSDDKSVAITASYSENELNYQDSVFPLFLQDLRLANNHIAEIKVGSLKSRDIQKVLSAAFGVSAQSTTKPLANAIYRKTGGNAHHVVQFIKALWDDGMLWFSFKKRCWQWEINVIESKNVFEDAT